MPTEGTPDDRTTIRARRPPPRFRPVRVRHVTDRSPRLRRITVAGPELRGFDAGLPAASVRLLLPGPNGLVMPEWNGNEFLLPDGARPPIRTLTPVRYDPDALELDVEVVRHGEGPLSTWAADAAPGQELAVSGTGRGFTVDPAVPGYVLAGDESALPAISMLLDAIPHPVPVQVLVELAAPDGHVTLPGDAATAWLDQADWRPGGALVEALTEVDVPEGHHVWVAGEAASMHRIRQHLFDERGLARSRATVRGYWKHGRASPG